MNLLFLTLWGGVVAVDNVSAVQSMVSRPLVAALVAGAILGDPVLGAQVGAVLELFLLVAIPAGGGRMPEGGTAAVVASAVAVAADGTGGFAMGISAGLLWGQLSGWTQTRLRALNGRYVPIPGRVPVTAAVVERITVVGLAVDFLRGVLVTAGGAALAMVAAPRASAVWPFGAEVSDFIVLGGLISVGVLLRATRDRRAAVLFGMGIVLGVLAGVAR